MDLSIVPEKETAEDRYERRFELKRELGILYSRLAPSSRKYITADAVVEAFENPGTSILLADGAPVKLDYMATLRRQAAAISPKLTIEREMVRWRGGYRSYNHEFTVSLVAEQLHDRSPSIPAPLYPEFAHLEFHTGKWRDEFQPPSRCVIYLAVGHRHMADGTTKQAVYAGKTVNGMKQRAREHDTNGGDRRLDFVAEWYMAWELPSSWKSTRTTEGGIALAEALLIYTLAQSLDSSKVWLDNQHFVTKIRKIDSAEDRENVERFIRRVCSKIEAHFGYSLTQQTLPVWSSGGYASCEYRFKNSREIRSICHSAGWIHTRRRSIDTPLQEGCDCIVGSKHSAIPYTLLG